MAYLRINRPPAPKPGPTGRAPSGEPLPVNRPLPEATGAVPKRRPVAKAKAAGPVPADAEYLTVLQVARLFGVSRSLVYKLVDSGKLPCVRLGAAVRIPRSALETPRAGLESPPVEEKKAPEPKPTPRPRRAGGTSAFDWRAVLGIA
jgi:excisionase family DNA binding protein